MQMPPAYVLRTALKSIYFSRYGVHAILETVYQKIMLELDARLQCTKIYRNCDTDVISDGKRSYVATFSY